MHELAAYEGGLEAIEAALRACEEEQRRRKNEIGMEWDKLSIEELRTMRALLEKASPNTERINAIA
jgi:hypothetical protein